MYLFFPGNQAQSHFCFYEVCWQGLRLTFQANYFDANRAPLDSSHWEVKWVWDIRVKVHVTMITLIPSSRMLWRLTPTLTLFDVLLTMHTWDPVNIPQTLKSACTGPLNRSVYRAGTDASRVRVVLQVLWSWCGPEDYGLETWLRRGRPKNKRKNTVQVRIDFNRYTVLVCNLVGCGSSIAIQWGSFELDLRSRIWTTQTDNLPIGSRDGMRFCCHVAFMQCVRAHSVDSVVVNRSCLPRLLPVWRRSNR